MDEENDVRLEIVGDVTVHLPGIGDVKVPDAVVHSEGIFGALEYAFLAAPGEEKENHHE